uniref:NADH dehydrogenase subunit 2 n=1 Tax=Meloe mediterraneus TaxID=2781717 RepID=UPI001EDFE8C5|nr:NADH dehydrogenase subunit 2 [Meloe mediterraneus]UKE80249.1 NADH dehydrogenase subunit 2 [Meloe mediterraneus]
MYKILFFNSMIMGTLIAISSYTWLGMWVGLEINLLSIIPLMNSSKNMFSSEASLKYFITQALASLILLLSILLMLVTNEFITPMVNSALVTLLNSALLTKLGAAPFHYWFPEVLEGLNWINCSILLTWQKIAPMALLMNNTIQTKFLFIVIIVSLLVSTTMSLNQISLRKIMAFSSINHIAWMISSMMTSFSIWLIYLSIYMVITLTITWIFNFKKMFFINQIPGILNKDKSMKLTFMINFLSLGGLPPFLGFLPKWLAVNWLIMNNYELLSIILIMSTLVLLFVYIRVLLTALVMMHSEPKLLSKKVNKHSLALINFFSITSLISSTFLYNFL